MARIRGRAAAAQHKPQQLPQEEAHVVGTEVLKWLNSLPLAPEYHPTMDEFKDPITYIHKIEKEASEYGICKIIPPVSMPSTETTLVELNHSLLAFSESSKPKSGPTFTTRQQQVGFCPRLQHPVWQSGVTYTLPQFQVKAKLFERHFLKNFCNDKGGLSPLEIETLYWNAANLDKPFSVEYADDMPGSAFVDFDAKVKRVSLSTNELTVGETAWNMRGVARSKGSPLRFMKDDVPGVTSPMLYIGMMFSWFGWHVEDHDLHSLNYLHMGEAKTWYGVPKDAALAFEEVIRSQAYGGEINPISTVAALGKKTTVMSPDAILNAGIPCCRLVQKAGEFVVTFPRAYHSGFSHGFNCAEASNIATPEWLRFAKQAAIRRASINCPPILSHIQLLYSQALSLSSRVPRRIASVPRSSRLKERKIGEGERLVKELFVQDVMHNSDLLDSLGKGSPIVLLPRDFADISMHTKTHIGSPLSCVTCGSLCFACVAILQPGEVAAYNYSPGRVDNSSLSLLALNYGDSSDSEDDLVHAPTTVAVQNRTIHFGSYSDKASSRLHIFCLEHAIEVEQKLRALGGVHMLILCHPDYQKLQDQAKIMAKELGSNHHCSNITFTKATKEHEEIVRTAVNLEKSIHGTADWTVRLGVNHFHNINVSRSSLYGRQMTYNSDKHRAFGHTSSEIALKQGTTDSTPTSRDGSLKAQAEDNAPKNRYMFQYKRRYKNKLKEKEIKKETPQLINNDARDVEIRSEGGWSSRLRKRTIKQVTEKCAEVVAESKRHKCSKRAESTSAPTKMNKKVEDDETEHACKVEGCVITFNSEQELMLHEQNVCPVKECGKSFFSHKYLLQHQRVHRDDRPFKCPWKDCNMTFKWAWARTEHIRVHTGVRPYTCTETGCGLTFRFVSDFSRHKRKTGHLRITEHSKKKGSKET